MIFSEQRGSRFAGLAIGGGEVRLVVVVAHHVEARGACCLVESVGHLLRLVDLGRVDLSGLFQADFKKLICNLYLLVDQIWVVEGGSVVHLEVLVLKRTKATLRIRQACKREELTCSRP